MTHIPSPLSDLIAALETATGPSREQVTLPRRSFLGWTAAIAGCALLTRPALAVPDWTSESHMLPYNPGTGWVISGTMHRGWASPVDMLADGLMYDYAMPEAKAREMALRMVHTN